jgi:hypothetical protein
MKQEIEFTVICSGDSEVFRALGVPLAEALAAGSPEIQIRKKAFPEVLQLSGRPVAGAGAVAAAIGVIAFLSSWALKKALDELYSSTIRPKIIDVLRSAAAQALSRSTGKKWLFQLGVWYEQERVFILLVLVGDSLMEVTAQEHLLPQLHAQAINWIRENRTDLPVHVYIAEDGKANLAPITFNHAADAQSFLERCWPIVIPTDGTSP